MRKLLPFVGLAILLFTTFFISCKNSLDNTPAAISVNEREGENDMYDGPAERDQLEFEKTKDPALGYIPAGRLINAIDYTENLKKANPAARFGMLWNERGPVFDSVGPSNGNTRGGGGYTSGRMRAVLIDTLNDPTGNTVIIGGVSGGVWKCTNFLSSSPNWQTVSDYFDNIAISSICQDPTDPATIYFSTGEPTANADAVTGAGVWKSTDRGNTWAKLPSTVTFGRTFKLLCDAAGNIYLASRSTVAPFVSVSGLFRSNNKGLTWTNITPNNLTSINTICTDIEISSTGRLHASFGYNTGGASTVNHRYTSNPATVTSAGWGSGAGIRLSTVSAIRMELAVLGDIVYAVTVNSAANVDSCYKSVDGGATWTKQNSAIYPAGVANGQGWYNLTLAINPVNSDEIMVGGLDAYGSVNSGQTVTRRTFWVTSLPYVHADHHFMQMFRVNGEDRVIIGCDGGIYQSRDAGTTYQDKNKGLGIKQFYAAAIHPAAGSNYLLAGAQDNGVHQISTPGLTHSKEVTGGDGCFVHINQQNPQVQFGSYVYNMYRRSVDGGQTWADLNLSTAAQGMFVNPWDYDDAQNILYGCWSAGQMVRLSNANTVTAAAAPTSRVLVPITGMTGSPSAFKVSPHTVNRLFVGANNGGLFRIDNANTTATATNIRGASFPTGFLSCINVGSTDNFLVAVFSNYGVNNIWFSNNGGTNWTAIDGNLPDMPVRWAVFVPGNDQRLMIATETGVFTTDLINGSATNWETSTSFPTVRTDMLKVRTSDNTVVAATHGRGLFTAQFPGSLLPLVNFASPSTTVTEDSTGSIGCRRYKDHTVNVGILNPPAGDATITFSVQAGNTATQGLDFDFTTNGSFTSPSAQVTFKSGDAIVVPIIVRIYDDGEIESTETFTIGFGITGTTNAAKGTTSAHTFTILDNDAAPLVPGPSNITVGTYNTDLSGSVTPFDGTRLKNRLQVIYTGGELKAAGFITAGPISSLTLRVKTKNTTKPFNGFTISIGHTGYTGLNTGYVPEALLPVFSANYSTVAGNNTFNFTTPFNWDGVSNVIVQFCYDNSPGTAEAVTDVFEGNTAPLGVYRASVYSNYTTQTAAGCALGAAFISFSRVNATFGSTLGNPVATALNVSKTEYLLSNNDLYYYSDKKEIIARIKNQSTHNYGCTQVTIDRAGNGATQFWNFNPANYLMNKTFHVTAATNNAAGKYEITFYYTKEEKEGWEAATGQSWNNIMLIKVPSRISNVTPLNAQPDGPGTVQIITPVRGTYGTGYTLTAAVENGFSGFGAGIPGRIHTVLTLAGQLDNNLRDINLNWTTSAEMGTATFEIEKSYDGRSFNRIATVAAAGTKLSPSNYSYIDKEYVQLNYYRIKMLYADGTVQYSNTIFIENINVPQRMNVLGNPFANYISIRFSKPPVSIVQFELFDMSGRMVARHLQTGGALLYRVNTSNIASTGIYRLRVYADNTVYYFTVLKQ